MRFLGVPSDIKIYKFLFSGYHRVFLGFLGVSGRFHEIHDYLNCLWDIIESPGVSKLKNLYLRVSYGFLGVL